MSVHAKIMEQTKTSGRKTMTKVLTGTSTYRVYRGENINNTHLIILSVRSVKVGPTGFAIFEHENGTTTGVAMMPGWYYEATPATIDSKYEAGDTVTYDRGGNRQGQSKIVRVQKAVNWNGEVEYMVGTRTSSMNVAEPELTKVTR